MSRDPVGYEGGDPNIFGFLSNSPFVYLDPYGLFSWSDYWYYLTNPGQMDKDLEIANGIAYGMVGVGAGGAVGIGVGTGVGIGVGTYTGSAGLGTFAGIGAGGVTGGHVGGMAGSYAGGEYGAPIGQTIGSFGGGLAGGIGTGGQLGAWGQTGAACAAVAPKIPGVGSKAVTPPGFGMGKGVAGKHPALMINGKVYAHHGHIGAQQMAGTPPKASDLYGFVELDATGKVIWAHWIH